MNEQVEMVTFAVSAFYCVYQQSYPHQFSDNCHSTVELQLALWHA